MDQIKFSARATARARWLWVSPFIVLLGLGLIVMTPGLLIHWQGDALGAPRPLARVAPSIRPAAPPRSLATIEPANDHLVH